MGCGETGGTRLSVSCLRRVNLAPQKFLYSVNLTPKNVLYSNYLVSDCDASFGVWVGVLVFYELCEIKYLELAGTNPGSPTKLDIES